MKQLIESIKTKLETHHSLYDTPVSGILWEEILYKSLLGLGRCDNTSWCHNSQRTGADIIGVQVHGNISCKSGTIKNNRLKFSGSRTTKYKTIEEKLSFLSEKSEDVYFCLSRNVKEWEQGNKIYYLSRFDHIKYNKMKWNEREKDWYALNNKMECYINKSMSDQLWTYLDMDHIIVDVINLDIL